MTLYLGTGFKEFAIGLTQPIIAHKTEATGASLEISCQLLHGVQAMPDAPVLIASGSLDGVDPISANSNPASGILNAKGISGSNSIPLNVLHKRKRASLITSVDKFAIQLWRCVHIGVQLG